MFHGILHIRNTYRGHFTTAIDNLLHPAAADVHDCSDTYAASELHRGQGVFDIIVTFLHRKGHFRFVGIVVTSVAAAKDIAVHGAASDVDVCSLVHRAKLTAAIDIALDESGAADVDRRGLRLTESKPDVVHSPAEGLQTSHAAAKDVTALGVLQAMDVGSCIVAVLHFFRFELRIRNMVRLLPCRQACRSYIVRHRDVFAVVADDTAADVDGGISVRLA